MKSILPQDQIASFLQHHWQQRHFLFKQLLPGYQLPLSLDELAGLACEEGIDSRIIRQLSGQSWEVLFGPFQPEQFERLGEKDWILLINALDRVVDGFNPLLDQFDFLPSWRFDDIMVSYSVDGGSVGPHFDRYDVFLIQVSGRKRWQIAYNFNQRLLPDLPVKVLEYFEAEQSWDLDPGDVLYLPPNVAHHGIGLGEGTTLSIGFRAPDKKQLLHHYLDHTTDLGLFSDKNYSACEHGEISGEALQGIVKFVKEPFVDENEFVHWFAAYMSESDEDWEPSAINRKQIEIQLEQGTIKRLLRHPALRLYFFTDLENRRFLAINGQLIPLEPTQLPWIRSLCNRRDLPTAELPLHTRECRQMLAQWIRLGYFLPE